MAEEAARDRSEPLSGEDLGFWWGDQPRQRTAMAMLLLLDRRPHSDRLRAAVARAVEAVPRLRQRVVDAPFDLAKPRWEDDPTFDLDFHVRRYALSHADGSPQHATLDDLFQTHRTDLRAALRSHPPALGADRDSTAPAPAPRSSSACTTASPTAWAATRFSRR